MTTETTTGYDWTDIYKIDILAPADRDDTRDAQFHKDVLYECQSYIRKGASSERVQRAWTVLKRACLAPRVNLEMDAWHGTIYWAGRETDLTTLFIRLTEVLGCVGVVPQGLFVTYLTPILKATAFNPIRRYLEACLEANPEPWEGWASLCKDTLKDDSGVSQAMLTKWLIGVVSRGVDPGCKMRTALVLKGEQLAGKTDFFKAIGGKYYASRNSEMSDADVMRQIQRSLIMELEEMEAVLSVKSVESIKRFISVEMDSYRDLYQNEVQDHPRHCVFGGSVNSASFLRDETGNSRFHVIDVGSEKIDNDYVKANRDHIFAEAYRRYLDGERSWDDALTAAAAERALAFTPDNEFAGGVETQLAKLTDHYKTADIAFKLEDFITAAFQIRIGDQAKHVKKISSALSKLAVKRRIKRGTSNSNYYVPISSQAEPKDLKILAWEPQRSEWLTVA